MDHVTELKTQAEAFVDALDRHPLIGAVICGQATRAEYLAFLSGTYHYVRWSGYLLAETARGLRRSRRLPTLVAAIDAKAAEEGPHDRMLLRDLQRLGENAELVKGSRPSTSVRAFVANSVALAENDSPAYLGAAYMLEYISSKRARKAARELRRVKSVPGVDHALTFLDSHGHADIGHVAELEALLSDVTEPAARADILLSAQLLQRLYPGFFQLGAGGVPEPCFA